MMPCGYRGCRAVGLVRNAAAFFSSLRASKSDSESQSFSLTF